MGLSQEILVHMYLYVFQLFWIYLSCQNPEMYLKNAQGSNPGAHAYESCIYHCCKILLQLS